MARKRRHRKFTVIVTSEVEVTLDPSLKPEASFRKSFYDFRSLEDVARHVAYNHVCNGVERINQLDGYADRKPEDATMRIVECGTEIED